MLPGLKTIMRINKLLCKVNSSAAKAFIDAVIEYNDCERQNFLGIANKPGKEGKAKVIAKEQNNYTIDCS
jgi:hypothetical protein